MKKFLAIAAVAAMLMACGPDEPGTDPGTDPGTNPGDNTENTDLAECLQGSDYYLIALDATTYEQIKNKVVADLRVDDFNTHLWIWENTYVAGEGTGPNYYSELEGWISLDVAVGTTWSGAGFCCYNPENLAKLTAITAAPEEYTLHLAMKSQDNAIHTFVLYSNGGAEAKVEIGTPDSGHLYNYKRDGEWYEITIPMTYFTNNGLLWSEGLGAGAVPGDNVATAPTGGHNVLAILSGASGSLNLDATFIYKAKK